MGHYPVGQTPELSPVRLYRVVVHGSGFWNEALKEEIGFFATRWVKAETPEEAGKLTMSAVGAESRVKALIPPTGCKAIIELEDVELETDPEPGQIERMGFIFY
jgi:hypothetical protein